MTTPERPTEPRAGPGPWPDAPEVAGWDDERLEAAFSMRASRTAVPTDLVATTLERLRPAARRSPWTRLLPAGAALVLVLGVVGGSIALLGGSGGLLGGGSVSFRDGPTPDLRTLDGGEYAFDFPATWLAYTASAISGSGDSIDAVLTTQSIEDRCQGVTGVDINCVYEQRLEPGQLRVFVGSGAYRSYTVLDRADIENGTTTRLVAGGMPAILDEFDDAPDDYYLADQSASWAIATPASLDRVVRIEFRARDPEAAAARAAVDALVASFRFTPPPTPLPDDPEAAIAAARAALDAEAASFRQGFVPADDPDGQTYLDCLAPVPGEDRVIGVDYGPGGDLGWTVRTSCRWTVRSDTNGPFWRIDTVFEWTVGDDFGQFRRLYLIDAAATVVARMGSDDGIPARPDPAPTPTPSPTPTQSPIMTLPSWGPWPPEGATVVELANGDPSEPARVAVVDRSGQLAGVRAPTAEDGYPEGPEGSLFRDPAEPGRYRLRWSTTICDREMTVTIDPDVERIVIEHAPRNGCDAMGVGRELVLEFARDVDPADITVDVIPATLLPEAVDPGVQAEIFGLEVIDVEAALAIRARPEDDREIAVSGWFWENPSIARCWFAPEALFFGEDCGLWDALEHRPGGGPRMPLYFGQAVTNVDMPEPSTAAIVVIGHFDDRRSDACGPALADACADVFWVDTIWLDGAPIARDWTASTSDEPAPTGSHESAWTRVASPDEGSLIPLSVGLIPGSMLGTLEPASIGQVPSNEPWIWHVTGLDPASGRLRTFVIPDSVLSNVEGVMSYEIDGDEVVVTVAIID